MSDEKKRKPEGDDQGEENGKPVTTQDGENPEPPPPPPPGETPGPGK